MGKTISVFVNEYEQSVQKGISLGHLRDRFKPDADVLIVNGFPAKEDYTLEEGDRVVLILRGEPPKEEDLEALMAARHTPGVHKRMKKAVVGIAGLGGLGSAAAIALARMGIGTLILVDFDLVEPSNLNRQQYYVEHINLPKIDAMKEILSKINPYLKITAHKLRLNKENIPLVFKDADVILECFDGADAKVMILEAVAEFLPGTYIIGASGLAGYGDSNSILTRQLGDKTFIVGDLNKAAEPGRGLMAPRVGIAAHHQANLAVSLLMNPKEALAEIVDDIE